MGCESNGIVVNQFALVAYIPEPLSTFLDELRIALVPGCMPHAHVSVLPPRALSVDWKQASEQGRSLAAGFDSFEIEAGEMAIFPVTDVIYLEISKGADELRRMHNAMNSDALAFDEPFIYHPHVTLAQQLEPSNVQSVYAEACRRWAAYAGKRSFWAEKLVFVQNTEDKGWIDLTQFTLRGVPVAG
jgi:2'-5' RNA ligase